MSQVTSESILTTKEIVEQAIKDYHKQILPYLNGSYPTPIANKIAKGNIYSEEEKMIGQWIDGKPLYQIAMPANGHVPTLSNDNSRIIKSGQHSTFYAWKAFDGDVNTSWDAGATSGYIGWDFENPVIVHVVKFSQPSTRLPQYPIASVTLKCSDDNNIWTTVQTFVSGTDYQADANIYKMPVTAEVEEHRYWRADVVCSGGWAQVATLNFIASELPDNINVIVEKYASNGYAIYQYTKISDLPITIGEDTDYSTTEKVIGTWIDGKPIYQIVSNSPEAKTRGDLFKPNMTSNNAPSPYVATSSALYNSNMQPYKAFDGARYLSGDPDFTDGKDSYYWMPSQIAGSWIKIDLGENNAKEFVNVGLGGIADSYISCLPKSFTISGSNDDNDYTVLYTSDPDRENGASTDAYLVENFEFERTGQYRYYKLDINTIFTGGDNVRVDCIKFYESGQSIAPNIDKVLSKVHMGDMYVYQYTKTTD